MGWLWSSSPSLEKQSSTDDASKDNGFGLSEDQKARILGRAGFTPKPTASSRSREEQADAELDEFIKSFSSPETHSQNPTTENATPPSKPETPTNHDRILPDGSLNIHPEALYPRTMSCRAAFDQAFYCQSIGGKFNDLYRFGHVKECSEQWGAFWFCMRTRTYGEEEKQKLIRQHYREREERKKKEFGSSEDIWDLRTKAVVQAFHKDPDAEDDGYSVPS